MTDEDDRPVFMISVAAKLTGMHPQTLRLYERKQLLAPGRTAKSTRLYSHRDIARLRYIQELTQQQGVNLAGVRLITELKSQLDAIQDALDEARNQVRLAEDRMTEEITRVHRSYRRDLVRRKKAEIVRHNGW